MVILRRHRQGESTGGGGSLAVRARTAFGLPRGHAILPLKDVQSATIVCAWSIPTGDSCAMRMRNIHALLLILAFLAALAVQICVTSTGLPVSIDLNAASSAATSASIYSTGIGYGAWPVTASANAS